MQAKSGSTILAESDNTVVVEGLSARPLFSTRLTRAVTGNHYFPPDAIKKQFFKDSGAHTTCPWKGEASYYNVEVDGKTITDAAWYYPTPKDKALHLKNYVAFYKTKVSVA
ncbi:hypothetical protein FRC10_001690 [Ceratobasidium sp. 414]|nr:hypothetical protein FRC10_001690 [Ceratobasidium sp. 414]